MSFTPLKVVFVGPVQSGKSYLANMLADAKENPGTSSYRPTHGCRVLEMQLQNGKNSASKGPIELQIWDCSGDERFRSCWPAVNRDAHAVVFVYCPVSNIQNDQNPVNENLDIFNEHFHNDLPENRFLLVANQHNSHISYPPKLPGALGRFKQVIWEENNRVVSEFQTFVSALHSEISLQREEEEQNILQARKL